MAAAIPKPRRTLTGGLQWALPGSEMVVQWWGEGSSLVLASTKPGGIWTNIIFEGYAKPFSTPADAKAAFAEFFTRDGA